MPRTEPWRGWGAVPAALVLALLFGGALGESLVSSLEGDAWRRVFSSDELWPSLALTWAVALSSTALASVLGLAMALAVRRVAGTVGGRAARLFLQVPLPVPHLVVAIAMLMLLSQSGLLNRVLGVVGLALPSLVNDAFGVGIILTYVWKEAPFVAVMVLSGLRGETLKLEEVARNLGASRWRVLRDVTLPAALPAVRAGAVLAFAYAFGAFEVPRLLGQTRPSMLGVWSWRLYTDVDLARRPEGMVVALLVFGSVALAVTVTLSGFRSRAR